MKNSKNNSVLFKGKNRYPDRDSACHNRDQFADFGQYSSQVNVQIGTCSKVILAALTVIFVNIPPETTYVPTGTCEKLPTFSLIHSIDVGSY